MSKDCVQVGIPLKLFAQYVAGAFFNNNQVAEYLMKKSHWLGAACARARHLVMASLVLVTPVTLVAAPVTIDFDDIASGVVVGSTYSGLGVTFVDAITDNLVSNPGASAPNTIRHVLSGYGTAQFDPIEAIFSSAVSSVSLTGIDVGSINGFIFKAYDAVSGGSLLDSDQVFGTTTGGLDEYFTLSLAAAGIRRVEFSLVTNLPGDGISFDNLTFDMAAVPVPAAVWLFGSGVLGLAGMARRKQAA